MRGDASFSFERPWNFCHFDFSSLSTVFVNLEMKDESAPFVFLSLAAAPLIAIVAANFKRSFAQKKINPEAAFPTAQLVCAIRALDASGSNPQIGKNIGALPDLAAAKFQGELGTQFLQKFADVFKTTDFSAMSGVIARTKVYDNEWVSF